MNLRMKAAVVNRAAAGVRWFFAAVPMRRPRKLCLLNLKPNAHNRARRSLSKKGTARVLSGACATQLFEGKWGEPHERR